MQLIGIVGGVEVRFDFTPPNLFTAEIPKRLDGVYIVQLQAIDDAGNVSNYSSVVIRIDYSSMKIKILPYQIREVDFSNMYKANTLDSSYSEKLVSTEFASQALKTHFDFIILEL